jgi:hypothetical protein
MMNPTSSPEQSKTDGNSGKRGSTTSTQTPPDTAQNARDVEEKRRHSRSENALQSSQDKNPIPPGTTRDS